MAAVATPQPTAGNPSLQYHQSAEDPAALESGHDFGAETSGDPAEKDQAPQPAEWFRATCNLNRSVPPVCASS